MYVRTPSSTGSNESSSLGNEFYPNSSGGFGGNFTSSNTYQFQMPQQQQQNTPQSISPPYKDPSSLDYYPRYNNPSSLEAEIPTLPLPLPLRLSTGGTTTITNNNNNYYNSNSSSSFKSSINSKLSQMHGPLLLSDIYKESMQARTYIEPAAVDSEEPAFASMSSSKTTDSDVGEFVRLCRIAPPLKLFDGGNSTEPIHQIDRVIEELGNLQLK
eukprot:gene8688-10206_t